MDHNAEVMDKTAMVTIDSLKTGTVSQITEIEWWSVFWPQHALAAQHVCGPSLVAGSQSAVVWQLLEYAA